MDNQIKENRRDVSSVAESSAQAATDELLTCHNYWCNYSTREPLSRCPKCGRPLLTTHTYRLLGLALVFVGGALAVTGALLLILAAPKLIGGMEVQLFVWSIFGLLLAVGLMIMTAGFWQAVFGRRQQSLMAFVIALLIALMLVAVIARAVL
jgi:hypothetical protein